jgi:hypothetical protein
MVRWLEKYQINSTVRLHNKEALDYWKDPESELKSFDPAKDGLDQTIYNFIVPTKRRKVDLTSMELGSEHDY